jgi:hypothetical protein
VLSEFYFAFKGCFAAFLSGSALAPVSTITPLPPLFSFLQNIVW